MADEPKPEADGLVALARELESVRRLSQKAFAEAQKASESAASALRQLSRLQAISAQVHDIHRRLEEAVFADEETLRRVAGQVAAASSDTLRDLSDEVRALGENVQTLLDASERRRNGGPAQLSWFDVDGEQAQSLLANLNGWILGVGVHYPELRKALYDCWIYHPAVVDDLLWLYSYWLWAYRDSDAPVTRAAEWRDRWLPGVARRTEKELTNCARDHRPGDDSAARDGDVTKLRNALTVDVLADQAVNWARRGPVTGA